MEVDGTLTCRHDELARCVWEAGLLRMLRAPNRLAEHLAHHYLLAHTGEAGVCCSVIAGYGLARAVRAAAEAERPPDGVNGRADESADLARRVHHLFERGQTRADAKGARQDVVRVQPVGGAELSGEGNLFD